MTSRVHCEIRGNPFPSICAAARHFNVCKQTVQTALDQGRMDGVGLGRNHASKKPVWLDGVRYDSQDAICAAKGISRSCISMPISRAKRHGLLVARTKWGVLTWTAQLRATEGVTTQCVM